MAIAESKILALPFIDSIQGDPRLGTTTVTKLKNKRGNVNTKA